MKLSIIIPVYNEEKTVALVLDKLKGLEFPFETEVVLVNDGSTDGTGKIVEALRKGNAFKVIRLPENRGKGVAIRRGLEHIEGDCFIVQDADLELDPTDIIEMSKRMREENAQIVYGSRFKLADNKMRGIPWLTLLVNRVLTLYTNLLFRSRLTDMATCYKLIRTEIIKKIKLEATGFEYEPEITAKLLRLGYHIIEVPVSYSPRSYNEGKKIRWRDGIRYLYTLTRYRIAEKDSFMRSSKNHALL
ncbi:MAG: glycosyltransferase family 2 protein [Deltaproteobacteria bacterium]|nr:glycosyltransferase family 2 protein [Deltaproteobacteria bacterium]